jgi:hypothetical protein
MAKSPEPFPVKLSMIIFSEWSLAYSLPSFGGKGSFCLNGTQSILLIVHSYYRRSAAEAPSINDYKSIYPLYATLNKKKRNSLVLLLLKTKH